jgi:multicomponent Na+:H+ antiporter subunit E
MSARTIRRSLPRGALMALLWWVITEGDPEAWGFGVVAVVAATLVSLALFPSTGLRWSLVGLARFLPFFAVQTVLGSIDVVRRVFDPRLPLNPTFLEYTFRLSEEPPRVLFANALSLLPGTISVEMRGDRLTVHVIDAGLPVLETLRVLEERVAAVFDQDLRREGS